MTPIDIAIKMNAELREHMRIHHAPARKTTYFRDSIRYIESYFGKHFGHDENAPKGEVIFDLFVRDCHQFMFTLDPDGPSSDDLVVPVGEMVDLPFPCICIESIGGHITVPRIDDQVKMYINAIFVRETAPREYEFLVHNSFKTTTGEMTSTVFTVSRESTRGTNVFEIYNGLVKSFIDRISKEKMGQVKNKEPIKLRKGSIKKFYKPKPITVISPKKVLPVTVSVDGQARDVDWSHRWEVRGHWRTVIGLGKDRDGEYTVAGFTWVVNHVKGPEDKPVMKKTYVVQG